MVSLPIFYAVLENDIRRVLSYSLMNQVGFMLVGIGIGTELALNGSVAHAFCHIIYKALLFMAAGSVLQMTGKIKCTEIGGLYKTMPLTCLFCMVGAASISAFPLFSGFVSKSMIISASAHEKIFLIWMVLQFEKCSCPPVSLSDGVAVCLHRCGGPCRNKGAVLHFFRPRFRYPGQGTPLKYVACNGNCCIFMRWPGSLLSTFVQSSPISGSL